MPATHRGTNRVDGCGQCACRAPPGYLVVRRGSRAGRVRPAALEPFEPALIQPSSIDVPASTGGSGSSTTTSTPTSIRAQRQDDLTTLVEVPTVSRSCCTRASSCSPPRSRSSRWATTRRADRGQVQPRPAGAAHPLDGRLHRPRLLRPRDAGTVQRGHLPMTLWPGMKIGQLCVFRLPRRPSTRTARPSTAPATRASAAPPRAVPGRTGRPEPVP